MASVSQKNTISLGTMQKNRLIESIRLRPCIWDIHHPEFKSSVSRHQAFVELAEELSDSDHTYTRSEILEEWSKIRYCFVRCIKKLLASNDESQAVSWPYWNKMQFMYESTKEHLRTSGASNQELYTPAIRQNRKRNFHRSQSDERDIIEDVPISYGNASPNDVLASNVLSAINSRKQFQHEHASSRSSAGPRSVFDELLDDSDFNANVKSESTPHEEQLSKIGRNNVEEVQIPESSWSDAETQQFLLSSMKSPSMDSSINSNSGCKTIPKIMNTKESNSGMPKRNIPNNPNIQQPPQQNIRRADSSSNGDAKASETVNTDVNESFGRYMIRQMQLVAQQNPTLGVLLRKELMEVCCKYELQAFSS